MSSFSIGQVVILAAGKGRRLGRLDCPKTLLPIYKKVSIIDWQLSCFKRLLPDAKIRVVAGYRHELFAPYKEITVCYSPNYQHQNTAKSLLIGMEGVREDLLWINGDVLVSLEGLKLLVSTPPSALLVNDAQVGEEEVKYRTNEKDLIVELSKEVKEPQGESLGIHTMKKEELPLLRQLLENCAETDYFERALEAGLQKGLKLQAVHLEEDQCVEVDFAEDLIKAKALAKKLFTR